MKQIRVEHKANFTTVSNIFIKDKSLSLKAKGLLLLIMSLNDSEWDFSVNGLCSICKESKSAIYNAIEELIEYGYCYREQSRNENGQLQKMTYTFYEEPQAKQPLTDNQYAVNQHTDNQTQLNTNIINKKINKQKNKSLSLYKEDRTTKMPIAAEPSIPYGLPSYVENKYAEVWTEWLEYANATFKPIEKTLAIQYKRLVEFSKGNVSDARTIIENAIAGSYKMFTPLKTPSVGEEMSREETKWE